MRLLLIQRGREVIQHMNTNLSEEYHARLSQTRTLQNQKYGDGWLTIGFIVHCQTAKKFYAFGWYIVLRKLQCFASLVVYFKTLIHQKHWNCFSDGINTWWKFNPKVANHESSPKHNEFFCNWKELENKLRKEQTIDKKE